MPVSTARSRPDGGVRPGTLPAAGEAQLATAPDRHGRLPFPAGCCYHFANIETLHVRRSPRWLWFAGFLILTFLTVQLAAAAYACADGRVAVRPVMAMDEMADMADMTESCPEMAKRTPQDDSPHDGLCLEHCQAGTKSADHVSPQIPAFLPILLGQIEPTPIAALVPLSLAQGDAIARAPPPPIAILHCCFRT
ncbi:copper resistance protein [Ralstonia solanacearum]|nr:hypothetical protein LBM341_01273 [Ralstonia solanacearum]BEU54235.1 hypothetical protein MAFF211520_45270 [Ralstonia pseudosolanacearum]NJZ70416.1 copper resistance protein [Ralstonia solanacearum]NJZ80003.1 copper resistance protein [Ralstonia solanacearum]NJZ85302.1 copper resistance protein [Ralstonia solanacearum]